MAVIANRYGGRDPRALFEHADNAALAAKRGSPNLLLPGDVVMIPDVAAEQFSAPAGQAHVFEAKPRVQTLRVVLQDEQGRARAGVKWEIRVQGVKHAAGTTGGDGVVTTTLPLAVREATLHEGIDVATLRIGHLDPAATRDGTRVHYTGIKARLRALGYAPGEVDDSVTEETRRAVRAFRRDHALPDSDAADGDFVAALVKAYGC